MVGLKIHLAVCIARDFILMKTILEAIIANCCLCVEALLLLIEGLLGLYLLHEAVRARSLPRAPADINSALRAVAKVAFIAELEGVPVLLQRVFLEGSSAVFLAISRLIMRNPRLLAS